LKNLLNQYNPTVVFSVFPRRASFDHIALAQAAKEVTINQSEADLTYGYVIQSRNISPTIFPLLSEPVNKKILQAFGKQGFGKIFEKYLPFLKHYMQTLSEPLFRMTNEPRLGNFCSLPLEAERITNYRIPNLL
jgi:LmbE family N-acetylglucosaminyl deacetylase